MMKPEFPQKREQFLEKFNLKGQESIIKEKEDKVGRLTFEVFLDDISNSVFTLPENKDFNSLYTAWELYQIKTFSTKTVKEFEEALTSTTDNNEIFKKRGTS